MRAREGEEGRVRHPRPKGMGWQGKRLRRGEGFKFAAVRHFCDAGDVFSMVLLMFFKRERCLTS